MELDNFKGSPKSIFLTLDVKSSQVMYQEWQEW